jgi:TPR repeat protein
MRGRERWRRTGGWILIGWLILAGQAVVGAAESELDRLMAAAQAGRLAEVERLIAAGANVNAADKFDRTPLHWAAFNGHGAVVEALLKAGANVNAATQDGLTPLHWAAFNGHEAVVAALLKAGANVNAATQGGWTPLHAAAAFGHEAVVAALLKAGANVNAADKDGVTPLHLAADKGHGVILRLFVRHGAYWGDVVEKLDGSLVREFMPELQRKAQQGEAAAQANLAALYQRGIGVPRDARQAVAWYEQAAAQGYGWAQWELGRAYAEGRAVLRDDVLAWAWANLAAAGGLPYAAALREEVERRLTPAQRAEAQRLARTWRPGHALDARAVTEAEEPPSASGSGLIVSRRGHVLTNEHVVAGCRRLRAVVDGRARPAEVQATDAANDLALVRLPEPTEAVARWREGRPVQAGESVVVLGFPLSGLLSPDAVVTTGAVNALAGLKGDTRFLQISAPVQPGNSGGPVVDEAGLVVGVVVAKLDAMKLALATGDVPQNVNFAIKAAVARAFVEAQGVSVESGAGTARLTPADAAAAAKRWTVALQCWR